MKKFNLATAIVFTVTVLTGCAAGTGGSNDALGTATAIGGNIFKVAVDNQCRAELRANTAFRTIALTMSAQQQDALENNICGCVSQQALQNVSIIDMTQAATNPAARDQIVVNTVAKTLNACYSQFMRR